MTLKDSIIFASSLNVGLRALYIADWNPEEKIVAFDTLEKMNLEVTKLRPTHNFSTEKAIQEVTKAVRMNVDIEVFDAMLEVLPAEAKEFWKDAKVND